MIGYMIFRAAIIWAAIAFMAIVNGLVRENIIAPTVGANVALPISGVTLSLIVLVITYASFKYLAATNKSNCVFIGAQWVFMTLAFEFVFGHYVAGKSWAEILQVFNVFSGDLFVLVIIVSLVSPYAVARIKGII